LAFRAVLDAPVTAVGGQNPFRVGLLRGSADNAIGDVAGVLAGLLVRRVSFDDERLGDVGKVDVVVEFGGDPDLADLDPAMIGGVTGDEIWLLPVLKIEHDVGKEPRVVAFDGEMIVRLAFVDEVVGELALGQKGIAADVLALDVEGIEQGGGHLDFVGAFDFIGTGYGQGTDFFWV
jgi:hypothetical protein